MPIRVVAGYDGSLSANTAISAGASLLPGAHALIAYLWTPPFTSSDVWQRLRAETATVDDLVAAIEREGAHEADEIAGMGVTLARAAGWDAEPLVRRSVGGEGLLVAQIAGEVDADVVLVGARGMRGTGAALGSVSDVVVHHSPRPVLVVPRPLLTAERAALAAGPVLVGYDGSAGAQLAAAAAGRLFPDRDVVLGVVGGEDAAPEPSEVPGAEVVTLPPVRRLGAPGHGVADALAGYARQRGAALVVVGSRGRSAVREILLGSVAKATLHTAHRPVMVVPSSS
jgi:nucleotide-binding universal stress UspA family protein